MKGYFKNRWSKDGNRRYDVNNPLDLFDVTVVDILWHFDYLMNGFGDNDFVFSDSRRVELIKGMYEGYIEFVSLPCCSDFKKFPKEVVDIYNFVCNFNGNVSCMLFYYEKRNI